MKKTRRSRMIAYLESDIQKVWDVMTDNESYQWRSDIAKVEVFNQGKTFIEYTSKGQATEFVITQKEECKKYAFDMKNNLFMATGRGSLPQQLQEEQRLF